MTWGMAAAAGGYYVSPAAAAIPEPGSINLTGHLLPESLRNPKRDPPGPQECADLQSCDAESLRSA